MNLVIGMLGARHDYQTSIENLEPRIARLQGLIDNEAALQVAAGEVDSRVMHLVYSDDLDQAAVTTDLQQDVRQMLIDAGLSVSNSQILPVREQEMFDYVAVKITATGGMSNLDAALRRITAHTPLILVESLEVYPRIKRRRGTSPSGQTVTVVMQLLSLRASQ